jgi:hypothetical protein
MFRPRNFAMKRKTSLRNNGPGTKLSQNTTSLAKIVMKRPHFQGRKRKTFLTNFPLAIITTEKIVENVEICY